MTDPDRPRKRQSGRPRKVTKNSPGVRGPKGNRPPQGAGPRAIDAIDPARRAARDVLKAVRERDAYANLVLPGLLRERKLDSRDAALATELAYGASRARGVLDAVIAHSAGRPAGEIDGPLLDILRLGTYQLLRTRVAPHAAVATSVDLARSEFGTGKAGFVNAVLRRVSERTAAQ